MFDTLAHDVRFALRQLRHSPGFAAVAVLTLALGIAANTTVFSIVNGVLVRPLPFRDASRLVAVRAADAMRPGLSLNLSYPDYLDIRSGVRAFQDVAVWDWQPYNLRTGSTAYFVGGARVSGSFFSTLGIAPILGRSFRAQDDRDGAAPVILLSEELWKSRFGGDPGVVGSTVHLDGTAYTVIGVEPAGIGFPERTRLWVPLRTTTERSPRTARYLGGIARLAPGATPESAHGELGAVASRLARAYPDIHRGLSFQVVDLRQELLGDALTPLFILLLVAVGVLLLIVCSNLANLLLARGARRERELAVRGALGASRGRLVRQLLTESVVLGIGGGGLGWLMGRWGVTLVLRAIPIEIPAWIHLEPDVRILAFVTGVSVAAVLFFGLLPAILTTRRDMETALREASGRTTEAGRARLRSGLVVAQVALSLTLLVAAALVLRSVIKLASVDPGFDPQGRLVATTALAPAVYGSDSSRIGFYRELLRKVEAIPGVQEAGIVSRLPLRGSSNSYTFTADGQGTEEQRHNPAVLTNPVSPGYFRAAGISLLSGRAFTSMDDADATPVGIINRQMADRYWPDGDALGKRIKYGGPDSHMPWIQIVGVVQDVRHMGLDREPTIQLYQPYPQLPAGRLGVVLHTAGDPNALRPALTAALRDVDPDQAFYDMMTLRQVVEEAGWEWRFFSALFWVFGGLAAFLAALGLYGVLSFGVVSRRREFGIRLALGAGPGDVVSQVLRSGASLFAMGAMLGLAAGVVVNRLMASVLYSVAPLDVPTFGAVLALLAVVAAGAIWLPARRATRVDPMNVLRSE
jgi:putative ABC transport system permease protein